MDTKSTNLKEAPEKFDTDKYTHMANVLEEYCPDVFFRMVRGPVSAEEFWEAVELLYNEIKEK